MKSELSDEQIKLQWKIAKALCEPAPGDYLFGTAGHKKWKWDTLKDRYFKLAANVMPFVRADLAETPAHDGWRPISTAPKDGTKIIVAVRHYVLGSAFWSDRWVGGGGWTTANNQLLAWDRMGEPTHWQPLPAPPQTPKGNQQ